jgi:hypothetical protein
MLLPALEVVGEASMVAVTVDLDAVVQPFKVASTK